MLYGGDILSQEIYDFGLRLKELREKKKLSQSQVARRLGLTRSSISGYENNITVPSIEGLKQLTLLYGTSADYILGLDNRKAFVIDGLTDREHALIEDVIQMLSIEFKCRRK